jgi:hypothetical protein
MDFFCDTCTHRQVDGYTVRKDERLLEEVVSAWFIDNQKDLLSKLSDMRIRKGQGGKKNIITKCLHLFLKYSFFLLILYCILVEGFGDDGSEEHVPLDQNVEVDPIVVFEIIKKSVLSTLLRP